jgi:hypothetical protein
MPWKEKIVHWASGTWRPSSCRICSATASLLLRPLFPSWPSHRPGPQAAALPVRQPSSIQCEESGNGAELAVMGCDSRRCIVSADRKNRLSFQEQPVWLETENAAGPTTRPHCVCAAATPIHLRVPQPAGPGLSQLLRQRRRREMLAAKYVRSGTVDADCS